MNIKHYLRLLMGKTLRASGLTEPVRKIYLETGHHFLSSLGILEGAWFRRSVVTKDFVPVISDIDLTILINKAQLDTFFRTQKLKNRHSLLNDFQILYTPFLARWERTGGLRNRQIKTWIPALDSPVSLSVPGEKVRSILAFESAHELYLLYKQLVPRLGRQHYDETTVKIFFELNRLIQFWATGDEELLIKPRSEFYFDIRQSELSFFKKLNELCTDLLRQIEPQLATVTPEKILLEEGQGWQRLNLKMENRFVTLTAPEKIPQLSRQFKGDFVATREFVALTKGAGIQDQPELNQLAWKESGYYRDFCTQRLAHDLIGCVLLNPENCRQLYYCFKNIEEFFRGFEGFTCAGWPKVKEWKETESFPLEREDILRCVLQNLELLESVR